MAALNPGKRKRNFPPDTVHTRSPDQVEMMCLKREGQRQRCCERPSTFW